MNFYSNFLIHLQLARLAHYSLALLVLYIIFYTLIIKPEQQELKRLRQLALLLKPGVIICGDDGIIGVVLTIFSHSVIVQLATGKKIEILKQHIRYVQNNL